ncbi:hypothetical protein GCM10010421_23580 [Streptomyces glaucus]|uniref:Uncharacterized protein n=1 Tax=Streptomyces glaucus TaxID=284029 RepID=A0ABN3JM67_9ACTN
MVRPRVERTTSWSTVLRSMNRERAETLLACALYGTRLEELAHARGQNWSSAWIARTGAVSQAQRLSVELQLDNILFPQSGDTLVIDDGLRALIREWRIEERFAPRCQQCDAPFARRAQGGRRPRKYCSNACRQKAYRRRNAAAHRAAEQGSECHTPEDVHRALAEGQKVGEVTICGVCAPGYPIRARLTNDV